MKLIRFLTFFFVFVGLNLQTTHLSHDKNDATNFLSCDITPIFFSVRTYTKLEIYPPSRSFVLIRYRKSLLTFQRNLLEHSPESLRLFPGIFSEHSQESLRTFPRIVSIIPRNLLEHSPESSSIFPGMLK